MSEGSTYVNNTDYNNVGKLLSALAGLGLLSAGAGMTVRGIQSLRNRVTELPISVIKKPSRFVQKQDRLRKILLNPNYTASGVPEPEDETVKTSSAKVSRYCNLLEKDSAWQDWLPWNWSKILDTGTKNVGAELARKAWEGLSGAATRTITPDQIGTGPKQYREIKKDAPLGERIKGNLATHPGFRSLWFLPGATAAIGLGYMGGDQLMSKIDDLLGSAKMRSVYKDKAEKIYQQSVKYLQDVAAGKIKTKKDEEDEQVKESSFKKEAVTGGKPAPAPPIEAITGNGSSAFLWSPNLLLALILAGLTAKQIKGGIRGFDAAKRELADRTHLQRAFQAAQKEREGDYNGLHLELDPELALTPQDKSLARKTNRLISDTEKNINPALRYENYQMENIRSKQNRIW